ncbi:ATP-binding protein [Streptomyces sp. NPDC058439]|uniref:ATP-binding protein n=1 Tax=Streptomyces sp. NPDC058439 TaxID=3346500 RepID=UPI00364D4118
MSSRVCCGPPAPGCGRTPEPQSEPRASGGRSAGTGVRTTGTAWRGAVMWEDAGHVIAELASNAALHGQVPGRDFRIMLTVTGDTLRIEVADALGDALPRIPERNDDSEAGRGLMLVEAIAIRWGVQMGPFPRKTVWAEVALTGT